jgi:hypothetical protein
MKDVTRIPAAIDQGGAKAANEPFPIVCMELYERTEPGRQQSEHE